MTTIHVRHLLKDQYFILTAVNSSFLKQLLIESPLWRYHTQLSAEGV